MNDFDKKILEIVSGTTNYYEAIEWLDDYFSDKGSHFHLSTLTYFLDKARTAQKAEVMEMTLS